MNKEDFITAAWSTCRIMALSTVRWHWKVRFWHSYWNFLCSLVCMTALSSMQKKKKSSFDFSWDIWVCNQEPLNAKMQDWRAFQKKPCVNNKFCCKNLNNSHVQFWSVSFLNSIKNLSTTAWWLLVFRHFVPTLMANTNIHVAKTSWMHSAPCGDLCPEICHDAKLNVFHVLPAV